MRYFTLWGSQNLGFYLVWKECKYSSRDGLFNPDGRLINDVGNFQSLSDAVLYNAIAHQLEGVPSTTYSQTAGLCCLLSTKKHTKVMH